MSEGVPNSREVRREFPFDEVVEGPFGGTVTVTLESPTQASIAIDGRTVQFTYEHGVTKAEVLILGDETSDERAVDVLVSGPRVRPLIPRIETMLHRLQHGEPPVSDHERARAQFASLDLNYNTMRADAEGIEYAEKRRAGDDPEYD